MANAPTTQRTSLIEGRMMRCPRCERQHDILRYVPLAMMPQYARETTPVYRCPSCKWIFAPADRFVLEVQDAD